MYVCPGETKRATHTHSPTPADPLCTLRHPTVRRPDGRRCQEHDPGHAHGVQRAPTHTHLPTFTHPVIPQCGDRVGDAHLPTPTYPLFTYPVVPQCGDRAGDAVKSTILDTLTGCMADAREDIRTAAAECVGKLAPFLSDSRLDEIADQMLEPATEAGVACARQTALAGEWVVSPCNSPFLPSFLLSFLPFVWLVVFGSLHARSVRKRARALHLRARQQQQAPPQTQCIDKHAPPQYPHTAMMAPGSVGGKIWPTRQEAILDLAATNCGAPVRKPPLPLLGVRVQISKTY